MSAIPGALPLSLTSPLGKALVATSFRGREALSELFEFEVRVLAENRTAVPFEKLLVQSVTVELTTQPGKTRHFNGIVRKVTEGDRDTTFTEYTLHVVPKVWVLTRTVRSRIFQHQSVPDILRKVLAGFDIKIELQGTFLPRRFVTQYRESDFAFACRLMEEEGIYYYFQHTASGHKMVLANFPSSHVDVAFQPEVNFDDALGGNRPDLRIDRWTKSQELRSGKTTLWDHCFEMPQRTLEASKAIQESVAAGKVVHKLRLGGNERWELYQYPGEFAERFDGIDRSGAAKPDDLGHLFTDNARTAGIRMQEEAVQSLNISGGGNCTQFSAGHRFHLRRHSHADDTYVLTSVEHVTTLQALRSGGSEAFTYANRFTCIPLTLPYRPPQVTPKQAIAGVQMGFVVGPAGEKIYCDKYGRVKVQLHWDREGEENADSSCWMRVSNPWGGPGWGGNFVPHVGQEVIVAFEEGDPDKPVVVGRVYNGEQMPPLGLPGNKTKSIIRDHGENQILMEGHAGEQHIIISSPHKNTLLSFGAAPPGIIPGVVDQGAGSGAGPKAAEVPPAPESPAPIPAAEAGSGAGCGIAWPADWLSREGINFATEAFWNVAIGQDVQWDIKGTKTERVVGNKINHLVGFKTDYIGGYERKHVVGFTHATTLGWKAEFIGGKKNEIIVGKATSLLRGDKLELIKGKTCKLHDGKEYKYMKNGQAEKAANLVQMYRDLKTMRKAEKQVVKEDKRVKVAEKYHTQAKKRVEIAEEVFRTTKGKYSRRAAKAELNCEQETCKVAETALLKAQEARTEANNIILKGSVKLG